MIHLPLLLAAALAADSTVYTVMNHERVAGSMVVVHSGDTTTVRFVYTDRNRGSRDFVRYVNRDGHVAFIESRPVLPDDGIGDAALRLELAGDSVRRWTPKSTTTSATKPGAYLGVEISPYDDATLAKYLLAQPSHTSLLSNGDTARADLLEEMDVPTARGNEHVKLVAFRRGSSPVPDFIWLDASDDLFATEVDWFMVLKPGAVPALPKLRAAEIAIRNAAADSLNARVRQKTARVVAIKNGDVFDSETGKMRPHTTVIMTGDRITAVGPADTTTIPSDATIVDATGKTIMPGMWDMHGHMQLVSQNIGGPLQLMYGITTVRDLGSDPDVAIANRERANAGQIAGPRAILSAFIDGPQKWVAPTPSFNVVSTEAEARMLVAHYDSLGYKQVKLYNLVHPDLVPTFSAEAKKRGMRLSGHIPRGLSVPAAIQLGFDEVNHAAFLFSTFYQDSLYVPKMRAYSAVASAVAPNIDVDGKPMTELIALLKQHNTVMDGTWAVWVQSAGTGIAQAVGAGVPPDVAKADRNYMRLLKRLYDAGVTLVPGTDDFGSTTFDTELELYEKVGIPAANVLQIATIVPARVMKDDRDYGSIAVGKVADLFIVNGKPAEHVSDVRKVEQVFRAGRMYDARTLREATGFHGK
jgi:imidazolonepropionase-like amidohydrolase